eukprot:g1803.t1
MTTLAANSADSQNANYDKAVELKSQGNVNFADSQFTKALTLYDQAIQSLSVEVEMESNSLELLSTLYLNRAACLLKVKADKNVRNLSPSVLERNTSQRCVQDCKKALSLLTQWHQHVENKGKDTEQKSTSNEKQQQQQEEEAEGETLSSSSQETLKRIEKLIVKALQRQALAHEKLDQIPEAKFALQEIVRRQPHSHSKNQKNKKKKNTNRALAYAKKHLARLQSKYAFQSSKSSHSTSKQFQSFLQELSTSSSKPSKADTKTIVSKIQSIAFYLNVKTCNLSTKDLNALASIITLYTSNFEKTPEITEISLQLFQQCIDGGYLVYPDKFPTVLTSWLKDSSSLATTKDDGGTPGKNCAAGMLLEQGNVNNNTASSSFSNDCTVKLQIKLVLVLRALACQLFQAKEQHLDMLQSLIDLIMLPICQTNHPVVPSLCRLAFSFLHTEAFYYHSLGLHVQDSKQKNSPISVVTLLDLGVNFKPSNLLSIIILALDRCEKSVDDSVIHLASLCIIDIINLNLHDTNPQNDLLSNSVLSTYLQNPSSPEQTCLALKIVTSLTLLLSTMTAEPKQKKMDEDNSSSPGLDAMGQLTAWLQEPSTLSSVFSHLFCKETDSKDGVDSKDIGNRKDSGKMVVVTTETKLAVLRLLITVTNSSDLFMQIWTQLQNEKELKLTLQQDQHSIHQENNSKEQERLAALFSHLHWTALTSNSTKIRAASTVALTKCFYALQKQANRAKASAITTSTSDKSNVPAGVALPLIKEALIETLKQQQPSTKGGQDNSINDDNVQLLEALSFMLHDVELKNQVCTDSQLLMNLKGILMKFNAAMMRTQEKKDVRDKAYTTSEDVLSHDDLYSTKDQLALLLCLQEITTNNADIQAKKLQEKGITPEQYEEFQRLTKLQQEKAQQAQNGDTLLAEEEKYVAEKDSQEQVMKRCKALVHSDIIASLACSLKYLSSQSIMVSTAAPSSSVRVVVRTLLNISRSVSNVLPKIFHSLNANDAIPSLLRLLEVIEKETQKKERTKNKKAIGRSPEDAKKTILSPVDIEFKHACTQLLSQVLIRTNPVLLQSHHLLTTVRPLLFQIEQSSDELQQFEALMALTNVVSGDGAAGIQSKNRVISTKGGLAKIYYQMFADNVSVRRAATECFANLLPHDAVFQFMIDNHDARQILVAFTRDAISDPHEEEGDEDSVVGAAAAADPRTEIEREKTASAACGALATLVLHATLARQLVTEHDLISVLLLLMILPDKPGLTLRAVVTFLHLFQTEEAEETGATADADDSKRDIPSMIKEMRFLIKDDIVVQVDKEKTQDTQGYSALQLLQILFSPERMKGLPQSISARLPLLLKKLAE